MSLTPLTPPFRFGTVAINPIESDTDPSAQQHLYRGAYPKARNRPFLSRLNLKTILSLTPKPLEQDKETAQWAAAKGIRLAHVRTEKPKDESGGLSRDGAGRALMVSSTHASSTEFTNWRDAA